MNRAEKEAAAFEQFDRHMVEATGYTLERYNMVRAVGPTALAHVQLYATLVDQSGAAELLERWAREERKSNAGRKPYMPFRALLTLHLMHTDSGTNRYNDVARTLYARLTPEGFDYLGITKKDGTQDEWYNRYWRSLNRLLALVTPWDAPRNTFLSAAAYKRALESYSQKRRDRMDIVMNRLAQAAARRLPKDIRDTYTGNVALDATPIKLTGRPNPNVGNLHSKRKNLDAMSGLTPAKVTMVLSSTATMNPPGKSKPSSPSPTTPTSPAASRPSSPDSPCTTPDEVSTARSSR